jgi:hypothetical protein
VTPDIIEEQLNIYLFHTQTLALARNDRWYAVLLAADLSEIEAKQIIIDVQAGEEMAVAA